MSKGKKHKTKVGQIELASSSLSPYISIGQAVGNKDNYFWLNGSDNLLPIAFARMNRRSSVQRALLNSRTVFTAGKKFMTENAELQEFLKRCNNNNESLRKLYKNLLYDEFSQGNAWVEVVKGDNFIHFYRHDPTTPRLGRNKFDGYVLLHPDWECVLSTPELIKKIPSYPNFEMGDDGALHSMVHIKQEEQQFQNYGIPSYIAGLMAAAIGYKTDKWNLSRLDNSFHTSAIITVEDDFDDDKEAEDLMNELKENYSGEGKTGSITFLVRQQGEATTTVQPIDTNNEGDWIDLHQKSSDDLVLAHGWWRSLMSFSDNTGFDNKRVLNEYQIALNTTILDKQSDYLELFKRLLEDYYEVDDLEIENKPPVSVLTLLDMDSFIKINEARKLAGLEEVPEGDKFIKTEKKNDVSSTNNG